MRGQGELKRLGAFLWYRKLLRCKFLTISLTALIDKNAIVIIDKGNADLHNIGVFL